MADNWWEADPIAEDNFWAQDAVVSSEPERSTFSRVAEQAGAGSQVGIANALGFPVDAVAGAISGVGDLTGLWGPIQDPIGGSASIDRLMQPLRADVPDPSTRGERVARRMGEEVGASAAMAPLGFMSGAVRAAPGAFLGTEAGSALGSGAAGAAANEVLPDSMAADIIASLAGGAAGATAAGRALGAGATGPVTRGGIEEQRQIASDAYGRVRADQSFLPQQELDDMTLGLMARMDAERINPRLQPGSSAVLDALVEDVGYGPMRVEDVENLRRMTTQSMPVTAAPADRRLSEIMKDEITAYLDQVGGESAEDLRTGRDAYRRAQAAQSVEDASTKAVRRAASTGSGGNEINAMRQNLRSILDNPRKAMSFTADELEAMDQIVRGTAGQNTLRRLSRFAPTSGGLSAMLGIGGTMASPAVALPIMAVTEAAKMAGERSSRGAVDALLQSIAPDRILQTGDQGINPVIRALIAGRAMAGDE